jgi:hypothetical protein
MMHTKEPIGLSVIDADPVSRPSSRWSYIATALEVVVEVKLDDIGLAANGLDAPVRVVGVRLTGKAGEYDVRAHDGGVRKHNIPGVPVPEKIYWGVIRITAEEWHEATSYALLCRDATGGLFLTRAVPITKIEGAVEIFVNEELRTVCSEITYEMIEGWSEKGASVLYTLPNGVSRMLWRGESIPPEAGTRFTAVRTDNA